jgi:hypothetical protein
VEKYLTYVGESGRPLFYVADADMTPPPVPGASSRKVLELRGRVPHWEETYVSRPRRPADYAYHLTVYRLEPT